MAVPGGASGQDFFKGKTVRFVVGYSAGGGFDAYTRIIARHIGKHIPGNPSTIVENMAGAASLIAANYIYNQAKPDGLTIGNWNGSLVLQQVMGFNPGIKFDGSKLEWLGVPGKADQVCGLIAATGITSIDKWLAAETPVKIGAIGPGDGTHDVPKLLLATLGLPIQLIMGYKGTADIRLAAESGEVSGACWGWETMKTTWSRAIESGKVRIVLQAVSEKITELPDVPNAVEYAKTDEARRLIQLGIHNLTAIARSYSLPPGTPGDRAKILKTAFMGTMRDGEFLAEANKAKLEINPIPGDELEKIVAGYFNLAPELLTKLKNILAPKK